MEKKTVEVIKTHPLNPPPPCQRGLTQSPAILSILFIHVNALRRTMDSVN